MKLSKIIAIADKVYPEGLVGMAFKTKAFSSKKSVGDGLAEFIARELEDTYDPKASKEDQLEEAKRVMENAWKELNDVYNAFLIARRGSCRTCPGGWRRAQEN
jgi:hypothetical protein